MSVTKAQLVGGVGVSTVSDLSVYGGVNATGVVTATSFSGDGSQLTGIDSTALKDSGGNVKVQANPSGIEVTGVTTITNGIGNVTIGIGTTALLVEGNARITGILTVGTGSITFDGTNNTINVGSGVTISASTGLTGSGANLTELNASNLGSGTVPDARFPATLPSASGANLTSLNASNLGSGTVPDARFPATLPSSSGANLTSLNASNISSGTLNNSRLPSNICVSGCVDSTSFKISTTEIVNSGRCLTNIANATTSATANTYVLRGADGKICSDSINVSPSLGDTFGGGRLINRYGGVYWIVSPYSADFEAQGYTMISAGTACAQSVTGCTGWFIPTISQMENPAWVGRGFWDCVRMSIYWSSTLAAPGTQYCIIDMRDGSKATRATAFNAYVRAFRCVTY